MPELNLEETIENAITDAATPEVVEATETETGTVETETTEATEATATDATEAAKTEVETQVASPAVAKPVEDAFAKKFGLPPSQAGRENRIPYSRVKAIVAKAEKEALEPFTAKLTDAETKLTTAEAKIADYDQRFQQIGQFEQVLLNDQPKFIQMLYGIPGYKELFDKMAGGPKETAPVDPLAEMPAPDQQQEDGTLIYSKDGLKKLFDWQAAQVEQKVEQRVTQRYAPIEKAWQAQEKMQALIPQIQAQVNDARTWPHFKDNEPEIVKLLQQYPKLSLEGAYQRVVFPKLQANRTTMREEILREIKAAPSGATSVTTQATRPSSDPTGPRSIEQVIEDSIKGMK